MIKVSSLIEENEFNVKDRPILKQFNNVFVEEILGSSCRREIDFSIQIILGSVPVFKSPYCINALE